MKHTGKEIRSFLFLSIVIGFFIACAPKADDEATPKIDLFGGRPRIAGPKIEGTWSSGCFSSGTDTSAQMALTFTAEKYSRTTESYEDRWCQKSTAKTVATGDFIFSRQYKDGAFEVTYANEYKPNAHMIMAEKIFVDSDLMFISHFQTGEDVIVDYRIPFRRIQPKPFSLNIFE